MIKCMDKATITRLILAVLGIVNIIVVALGHEAIELTEDKLYIISSIVYLIASCGWAIYKNNPTSEFGLACQRLKEICSKYEVGEVIEALLDKFPIEEPEDEDDESEDVNNG